MKNTYKRLDQYDRFEIEKLIALGKNNIQIARHKLDFVQVQFQEKYTG